MALTLSKLNPSNSLDTTITRKCVSEPISTIRYINHSGIDRPAILLYLSVQSACNFRL